MAGLAKIAVSRNGGYNAREQRRKRREWRGAWRPRMGADDADLGQMEQKETKEAKSRQPAGESGWLEGGSETVDDLDRFEADAGDLADEADDVLGVILAIGVGDDAGAFVGGDLVLVDDPFEGGAVAEAVVIDLLPTHCVPPPPGPT